jgi:hypothetical protein
MSQRQVRAHRRRQVARTLKRLAVVVAVSLVTLEVLSAAAIGLGVVPADAPNYRFPSSRPFWVDRNPYFGMWHEADTEYVHTKSCFSVTYRTNAYGARDRARQTTAKLPRVVMLGDSFTEGYGLERDDRTSDLLEAVTGVEHLNFGTSGHFGPTQSWLLYKHLAKRFEHDVVVLNLLPDNDFTDDDPKHAAAYPDQYRPYLVLKNGDYVVEYANAAKRGASERDLRREQRRYFARMLRNFTFSANAFNHFKGTMLQLAARDEGGAGNVGSGYSGYFDFTKTQAERLVEVLARLMEEAGERQVIVTLIPRPGDLETTSPSPLPGILAVLTGGYPNLHVIDFRDKFRGADWMSYYRDCDGHWSPKGAKAAAEVILADAVYRKVLGLK